jgi:Chitobiase/beta-hexosaminidase C-terminal domain
MSANVVIGVPGPQGPPGPTGAGTPGPPGPVGPVGPAGPAVTYLYPFIGTFAQLAAASQYAGSVAITTDQGLQLSNGIVWTPIEPPIQVPVLPNVYTYATLPAAVANPNTYAATSDVGAVYSTGSQWLLLYNPSNATLQISSNTPLPGAVNGTAYTETITCTNNTGSPTWFLQNLIGANVWAINSSTGVISLTPTHTETSVFMVQVSDTTGAAFQRIFTIVVAASAGTPAATPTFSPAAGTYSVAQTVTISCSTASPTIYYTTNGSTPTTASTVYTAPITVSATSTVQAIATASGFTQSAVGSAAYTITTSGAQYKFNPGDYMIPPQYGTLDGASTSNDLVWIKKLVANPCKGFIQQRHWSDLDQGSTIDNTSSHAVNGTGNFAGFTSQIGAAFNLLQTYQPGAHYGLYVNTIEQWGSTWPTGTFTSPVPNYIMNCGGAINIPNSFGSGSSTAFSMYKFSNSTCGVAFYAYNSPSTNDYGFLEAAWWDPAILAAITNFFQALALYQLPTATAYNSGTTYTLGALVTSGGNTYCSIQAGNLNNAVSNTTWWQPSSNAYAGQTLDQCPLVEFIGNNDETSATFTAGPAVPGSTSSANVCSYQNYYTGYLGHLYAKKAAFPHTMVGGCFSFVITGTTGEQDGSTWTGYLTSVNAQQGISFSQADIFYNTFTPGSAHPSNAMLADVGLNPDGSYGGTLPAFGSYSTNYVGVMPQIIQRQPEDYNGGSATTTNVNQLIASGAYLKETHRLWSPQDDTFSYNTWAAVIQPTFTAGTGVTTTRPSNLP